MEPIVHFFAGFENSCHACLEENFGAEVAEFDAKVQTGLV